MVGLVIIGFVILGIMALLSWIWACGFDYINENYPDYKGEDLFNENKNKII